MTTANGSQTGASSAPVSIAAYLDALKRALSGAPPALIRDALSDTEEHLRNECAGHPEQSEQHVLAGVIEVYGNPEEIAAEYRAMEQAMAGPFPKAEVSIGHTDSVFNVVRDPQAYGALLYMVLALATGIFYFTWSVVGIAITLGTASLIIGIPIALLIVGSVRALSHVEGRIVEGLLGVRMPRRLPPGPPAGQSLWTRIKDAVSDSRTWSSLAYFLLMLPLGILYFTVAAVMLSLSLGFTAGGLAGFLFGERTIMVDEGLKHAPWLATLVHALNSAPGHLAMIALGLIFIFLTLHFAKTVGRLHGRIAEKFLVRL